MKVFRQNYVISGTVKLFACFLINSKTFNQMALNNCKQHFSWNPRNIVTLSNEENTFRYVCIVLNRKIKVPTDIVRNAWRNAKFRCLVDGGANRWRHFLETHCHDRSLPQPDLIAGDFDSVTEDTFEYFKTTKRVHTPDQNATDFTKAIEVMKPFLEKEKINQVIVFHDTSGRFDQIMANVNTLFKVQSSILNVYLLSGTSMTWLLRPGKHSIRIPSELVENERWCALIPIGAAAKQVTTTGLKWNLCNSRLEFGGMVSTSNTYAAEHIEIETETALVWSMGLFCFDDTC